MYYYYKHKNYNITIEKYMLVLNPRPQRWWDKLYTPVHTKWLGVSRLKVIFWGLVTVTWFPATLWDVAKCIWH